MSIGERIQALRKARGLSQEELAAQIGVSRQAVSKWEAGQSQPDLDKVISMSRFFGVSTDYLLMGAAEAPSPSRIIQLPPPLQPDQRYFLIATAANLGIVLICVILRLCFLKYGWPESFSLFCCFLHIITIACLYAASSGLCLPDGKYVGKALRKKFWRFNIWIMLILPCILFYSYLREHHFDLPFVVVIVLYFLISIFVFIFNMADE